MNNTFLNGVLSEVYTEQLPGCIDQSASNVVRRLHKALYGLKQAPRAWFGKLNYSLVSFGFQSIRSD